MKFRYMWYRFGRLALLGSALSATLSMCGFHCWVEVAVAPTFLIPQPERMKGKKGEFMGNFVKDKIQQWCISILLIAC